MTYNIRRLGIFAGAGVVIATLIIAGIVTGGIAIPGLRLPSMASDKGTLIVKLTDAPVELEHLNVTIANVSACRVSNDEETWVKLPFVGGVSSVYIDILSLQNITKDLSVADVPPGNYTKLRLDVSTANATYVNGETVDLTVPPGHIDIIVHFEIKAGESTTVLLDMQADWVAISSSHKLRPVMKATVISGK